MAIFHRQLLLRQCWILAAAVLLWGIAPRALAGQASSQSPGAALRRHLVEGSQALNQGKAALAEEEFRRALSLDPKSFQILNDLAIALVRQNKISEGIVYYRRALAIRPGNFQTMLNLGIAYFRAQRFREALPLLEPLARRARANFQVNDLAGLTLFALNRFGEAATYLERASRARPKDLPTLYMTGKAQLRAADYSGVARTFARIMAVNPNSPEAHVLMGIAYDKRDMDRDALSEYLKAEKIAPDFPGVHSGLGQIYWRLGQMDQAQAEFESELKRFPADAVSNCLLGEILMRKAQPAKAVDYFHAALAANPRYKDALLGLGDAELDLNHPHRAKVLLERTVKLYPNSAKGHYELGNTLARLGQKRAAEREHAISSKIRAELQAQYTKKLNAAVQKSHHTSDPSAKKSQAR